VPLASVINATKFMLATLVTFDGTGIEKFLVIVDPDVVV